MLLQAVGLARLLAGGAAWGLAEGVAIRERPRGSAVAPAGSAAALCAHHAADAAAAAVLFVVPAVRGTAAVWLVAAHDLLG